MNKKYDYSIFSLRKRQIEAALMKLDENQFSRVEKALESARKRRSELEASKNASEQSELDAMIKESISSDDQEYANRVKARLLGG